MPPMALVFVGTGLAAWMNGMYFLGMASDKQEGAKDPLVSVGWTSLVAGIVDLASAWYILHFGEGVLLAGLIVFYGLFFVVLGITEIIGLDLRQIGNLAIPIAIVPLFWWEVFSGGWFSGRLLWCGPSPSWRSQPRSTGDSRPSSSAPSWCLGWPSRRSSCR